MAVPVVAKRRDRFAHEPVKSVTQRSGVTCECVDCVELYQFQVMINRGITRRVTHQGLLGEPFEHGTRTRSILL